MNRKKRNVLLKNILSIAIYIGLIDSAYLTVENLTRNQAMCLPGLGDCWTVSNSPYSRVFGIPVAAIGMIAYFVLLILVKYEDKFKKHQDFILLGTFGIALSGTIYSIYLTYLEIAVIKAVCPFCVISALAMVVILVCAALRLGDYQSEIKRQLEE